jgi:hypothetical protein
MKPGDKVICIDASIDTNNQEFVDFVKRCIPNWIKKDQEYTIRAINDLADIGAIGLLLEEIKNPLIPEGRILKKWIEPRFAIWRFRKIESITLSTEVEKENTVLIPN